MRLVRPAPDYLPGYVDALERGWSPRSNDPAHAARQLAQIREDEQAFLADLECRDPAGQTVVLPDGTSVPMLPQLVRWMWDGEFAGSISFRWQPGTTDLPSYCLGHIGYTVAEWKRRRGYATDALRDVLDLPRAEGLPWIDVTTDTGNVASQAVILANGGVLAEEFPIPASHGGGDGLRYRIDLGGSLPATPVR